MRQSVAPASVACFKCKKPIRVARDLTVHGDQTCPEIGALFFLLTELEEEISDAGYGYRLPGERLRRTSSAAMAAFTRADTRLSGSWQMPMCVLIASTRLSVSLISSFAAGVNSSDAPPGWS